MDNIQTGILGVQITLVAVLLEALFGEVASFGIVSLVVGIIGTIVVLVAVLDI